jgi:hypothetical protein
VTVDDILQFIISFTKAIIIYTTLLPFLKHFNFFYIIKFFLHTTKLSTFEMVEPNDLIILHS